MEEPKLTRDWQGGFIRSLSNVENGYGILPAGAIYKIESSGVKAVLISAKCKCCGYRQKVSAKGANKFSNFTWLGYDEPEGWNG